MPRSAVIFLCIQALLLGLLLWFQYSTTTLLISMAALGAGVIGAGLLNRSARERQHSLERALSESRSQQELHRARLAEQRIIHESMSTGMIALDQELRMLSANRAAQQLIGFTVNGDTNTRPLRELVHEPELNRFVTAALEGGKACSTEFSLANSKEVHALAEPLRNEDGHALGLLVLLTDVTRLRRLEEMRSDFAANVSHELRTPITNIQGYVETLQDVGTDDREQTTRFLGVIRRNTERLGLIIEDLLALSRLEQKEFRDTLQREEAMIQQIIHAAIAQVDQAVKEKRMVLSARVSQHLKANVNTQLLEQAIANLLSNAVKYSPPETRVSVNADWNGKGEIEIAVRDEGPGIAREHLPRLFERFYRVDRARSREMGGTGLGLAIVKHIAQAHGGRAEVESTLGKGSTFRIILPHSA